MCFRAIHDVKATDMGMSKVRFKAEVDFDGRVVTRSYLEKQDIEQLLQVCLKNCFCNHQYLILSNFINRGISNTSEPKTCK